jgi:hypothetical protein
MVNFILLYNVNYGSILYMKARFNVSSLSQKNPWYKGFVGAAFRNEYWISSKFTILARDFLRYREYLNKYRKNISTACSVIKIATKLLYVINNINLSEICRFT